MPEPKEENGIFNEAILLRMTKLMKDAINKLAASQDKKASELMREAMNLVIKNPMLLNPMQKLIHPKDELKIEKRIDNKLNNIEDNIKGLEKQISLFISQSTDIIPIDKELLTTRTKIKHALLLARNKYQLITREQITNYLVKKFPELEEFIINFKGYEAVLNELIKETVLLYNVSTKKYSWR